MDAKHPSSIAACGSKTCVAAKPHGDIGDNPHILALTFGSLQGESNQG